MTLRPYKFIIKAVPQIVDADGEVVGEEAGVQPVEMIGVKQAVQWVTEFPAKLAEAEAAQTPAPPPNRAARRAKPKQA
jgi:hypothetical protein